MGYRRCFAVNIFLFAFIQINLNRIISPLPLSAEGTIAFLCIRQSVCPSSVLSVCLFVQFSTLVYAFEESYETCWTASACQTTDQVYTFRASVWQIFGKKNILNIFFLMFGFDVYWKKKHEASMCSVITSCASCIITLNIFNKQISSEN